MSQLMTCAAEPNQQHARPPGKPWWLEVDAACLVVLVLAAYLLRAGTLPLRGEEPTRAQIAFEMVERGDWVVPRIQGDPFRIRPPLQNWVIAATCVAFGNWEPWTIRFPSVLATLLSTLLVYGYSRSFLSRAGSLASAAAFATLADMFQMGRQAETEALFLMLVGGSLLMWHWGTVQRWSETLTWTAGYGLTALAMLTKGLQAPTYFFGSIGLYILLTGTWRRLFTRGHLVAALVGAAILCGWIIPLWIVRGWADVQAAWTGDPALNIRTWVLRDVLMHLLTYPLEIVAGTLPWSVLLLLYVRRDFRQSLREARPHVLFIVICLAVAFPTCWIPPGGQPRFFAPMLPSLAVLIGVAIQRCSAVEAAPILRAAWRWYLSAVAGVMLVAAVVVVAARFLANEPLLAPWVEPPLRALGFAVVSVALALVTFRARVGGSPEQVRLGVLGVACFLVLTFSGFITDVRWRRCEDPATAVRELKERLPSGQQLVSLDGHVDSLFSYYYGLPIIRTGQWPAPGAELGTDVTYFCFMCSGDCRPSLPFVWEEIAAVSLDRNHHPIPERVVVVGRRMPPTDIVPVPEGLRAEKGASTVSTSPTLTR